MTTFAVLSDIHGNRWALEAVLEVLERHTIDQIVHLGDIFFGPLDPGGTAEVLHQAGGLAWPTVRGNQDRALGTPDPENATLTFTLAELSPELRQWAVALPLTVRVKTEEAHLFLCHGTPQRDDEVLIEKIEPGGVSLKGEAELEPYLAGIEGDILLCGHSHRPGWLKAGSRRILNPGSIGLPAYNAPLPYPHKMESGSPEARYALLEGIGEGEWRVDHRAVAYDHQAAAAAAERHRRPDWAAWISSGRGV